MSIVLKPLATTSIALSRDLNPPLTSLRSSNRPASQAEISFILSSIRSTERELTKIVKKDSGNQWTWRAELYRKHLAKQKSLLSPLRELPPEILTEIFLFCRVLDDDINRDNQPPWYLSQVCSRWRNIALSTPTLWGQIPAFRNGYTMATSSQETRLAFIPTYLERSRDSPCISILISTPIRVELITILNMLIPHSHRWKNLRIESSHSDVCYALHRIRGGLPTLRTLHMKVFCWGSPVAAPISVFELAPQLRDVQIYGDDVVPISLPWSQLRAIRFSPPTFPLAHILCDPQELRFLYYDFNRSVEAIMNHEVDTTLPERTLPKLITLALYSYVGNSQLSIASVLQTINTPALEVLYIGTKAALHIDQVLKLLSRSSYPALKKLKLQELQSIVEPDRLCNLLLHTPELLELHVTNPATKFLLALANNSAFLPCLTKLVVTYNFRHTIDERVWNQMAESRCETDSFKNNPLQILIILSQDSISPLSFEVQRHLGRWTGHNENPRLEIWRSELLARISEYTFFNGKCTTKRPSLHTVFSAIEKYEVTDVRLLYTSRLHLAVKKISELAPCTISGDAIYKYRRRAKDILDKWNVFFIQDLPNYRWAHHNHDSICLEYISSANTKLRNSAHALDIIYGMKCSAEYGDPHGLVLY